MDHEERKSNMDHEERKSNMDHEERKSNMDHEESIRLLFEPQLKNAIVNTGDWLDGKTFDEALKRLQNLGETPLSAHDHVTRKIAEWKAHKGERLTFFISRSINNDGCVKMEFKTLWEGDISELAKTHSIWHEQDLADCRSPDQLTRSTTLPILVKCP
jgi:hypothetical protein